MASVSQIVRTKTYDPTDLNNPTGIPLDIKYGRIIADDGAPADDVGENNDYYIDRESGNFYGPKITTWGPPIYNFATGTPGGGGIDNIINLDGVGLFRNLTGGGTIANFKGISGAPNVIDVVDLTTEVQLAMNDLYKPVSLSRVNNFPLQTGLGSETFDPNGVLGVDQGFTIGSLFVQTGTPNKLWICQNPTTKVWQEIQGVQDLQNIGGGTGIYDNTVSGVARLKSLTTIQDNVRVIDRGTSVEVVMSANYKPATLSNVDNVKIGYGSPSAPIPTNDNTQGYVKGSLFTEVEPSNAAKLWVATDVSTGAAQWQQIGGGGVASSVEYVQFKTTTRDYVWTPPVSATYFFLGAGFPTIITSSPGNKWSTAVVGDQVMFRRAAVESTGTYQITFKMICGENGGLSRTEEQRYIFEWRNDDTNTRYEQSIMVMSNVPSAIPNVINQVTGTFIFTEPDNGVRNYNIYALCRDSVGNQARPLEISTWALSIVEL